jgi:hypothetical protein
MRKRLMTDSEANITFSVHTRREEMYGWRLMQSSSNRFIESKSPLRMTATSSNQTAKHA